VGANLGLLLLSGFVKTEEPSRHDLTGERAAALSMRSTRAPNSTRTRSSTSTAFSLLTGIGLGQQSGSAISSHCWRFSSCCGSYVHKRKEESPFATRWTPPC